MSGTTVLRAFSQSDGAFSFKQLAPGTYTLCAQIPATQAAPSDDPFLDTCIWRDSTEPHIPLTAGQNVSNVALLVKRGKLLKIRVNDPQKLLPAQAGAGAGPHLQLQITSASLTAHRIPLTAQDANGRDFAIVIPTGVQHNINIASSAFRLADGNGAASAAAPVAIVAKPTDPPISYVVNVVGAKP